MKNILSCWKNYCDQIVSESRESIIFEIEQDKLEKLGKIVSNLTDKMDPKKLNFSNIFGDKLRIVEPFETLDSEDPMSLLMEAFVEVGAKPDFSKGTVTIQVQDREGNLRDRTMKIGKFLVKLNKDSEALRDIEAQAGNPNMDYSFDPTSGEWLLLPRDDNNPLQVKKKEMEEKFKKSYGDLDPKEDFLYKMPELIDFWNKKSAFYRENPEEAEGKKGIYSIVYSRAPIDVLRMSDYEDIESCHSPDGSYFKCAVEESKDGGFIAYVVKTKDLQKLEKMGIDLQDAEIFSDNERSKDGIVPVSRVRIRRYKYTSPLDGQERFLGAAESQTYGIRFPNLVAKTTDWLKSVQPEVQKMIDMKKYPDPDSFLLIGGSYQDTENHVVLNNLLDPSGRNKPYDESLDAVVSGPDDDSDLYDKIDNAIGDRDRYVDDKDDKDDYHYRPPVRKYAKGVSMDEEEFEDYVYDMLDEIQPEFWEIDWHSDYDDGHSILLHTSYKFDSSEDYTEKYDTNTIDKIISGLQSTVEGIIGHKLDKEGTRIRFDNDDKEMLFVVNTEKKVQNPQQVKEFMKKLYKFDKTFQQQRQAVGKMLQKYGILGKSKDKLRESVRHNTPLKIRILTKKR